MASWDSDKDDGDDLFDHETVATLPIPRPQGPTSSPPRRRSNSPPSPHKTQPTQPLTSPPSQVQVAASSPRSSTPPRPFQNNAVQRGALNGLHGGRFASMMAPPGTAFRAPGWQSQYASQSQRPQTQEPSFSDDETSGRQYSDDETQKQLQPSGLKKTKFVRNGVPLSQASPSRIEESPQPKRSFGHFSYQGSATVPSKRPADDLASSYAAGRRTKEPRQTAPAKAAPVVDNSMTLDDLSDHDVRNSVQRLQDMWPTCSIGECYAAYLRCSFRYEDTLNYLADQVERKAAAQDAIDLTSTSADERVMPRTAASVTSKPQAKRGVTTKQTIAEKYGTQLPRTNSSALKPNTVNITSSPPPEPPVQRKKRLVKPNRQPSPPSSPPVRSAPAPAKAKSQQPIELSEDEGITINANDDSSSDESGDAKTERPVGLETELLDFLNKCSNDELIEVSTQSFDVVKQVLEKRPFGSLDDVRAVVVEKKSTTKTGKTRTTKSAIGDRLVDVCLEMFDSYKVVDNLVAHCESLGAPVREEMKRWGFDTHNRGELELTEFEHDSGIGTPSSTASLDDDPKGKRKHLKQPKMMSDDMIMKDYQITGLNWLALLHFRRMSCILADDMGLGKTCQVIAFLAHLKESGKSSGPHLVVVPGSTLENWLREFQNFCPALSVKPYYGSQREREEHRLYLEENREDINVVVTTYEMALSPVDGKFLRKFEPSVCVFDEGHALKNSQTKRYRQLMRIPAKHRLLLTGTPLQNNLQELVSLLAFLMPDLFSEHDEELSRLFKHKATTTDKGGHAALLSKERIDRARSMMTPFILRRKKDQVLKHLPKKICHTQYCHMTPVQHEIYEQQRAKAKKLLKEQAHTQTAAKAKANVMMDLRKAAIHPLLFRNHFTDDKLWTMARSYKRVADVADVNENLVFEDLEVMTDFELNRFCDKYSRQMSKHKFDQSEYLDSGKVKELVQTLKKHKANGDRTLVFSQFTMVMDILEHVFEIEEISFSRLDGSTKMAERQDLIDQYYRDEGIQVFMLSTGAGGAGINLACANKVVIFDSSFNPHQDAQAENRAHRVGQTREVEVIRMVTKETVEEQIEALGNTKLALDQRVAGEQVDKDEQKKEAEGMQLVERMLLEGDDGDKPRAQKGDIKDEYMKGLQEAGLKVGDA